MTHKATCRCLMLAAPLFVAAVAEGKFAPLSLSNLCGSADLIVIGTINDVRVETFVVDVEQTVAGSSGSVPLEVRKFANWTCARRWASYEVGQRVLLFLTRGAPGNPHAWRIMGAGGEGEMLVEADIVHPRVRASGALVGELSDVYYSDKPQRVPLDPLLAAIRDHRRCFAFLTHPELGGACGVGSTCSIEVVDELRRCSDLHGFLFDQATTLAGTLVARGESGLREARAAMERGELVEAASQVKWAALSTECIGKSDVRYLETLRECAELMRRLGNHAEAQALEDRIRTPADPTARDAKP